MKQSTDSNQILSILRNLQLKIPFYLNISSSRIQIKVIAISSMGITIKLPDEVSFSKERIISIHFNGNKITILTNSTKTKHSGLEILKPLSMKIDQAIREDTNRLNTRDIFSELNVSKIVNVNAIPKYFGYESSKLSFIIQNYYDLLNQKFSKFIIYFSNKIDVRLRLLTKYSKPIYIPDKLGELQNNSKFVPIDEFFKKIVNNSLLPKEYNSEICMPIMYKNFFPLGYMQVNSHSKMDYPIVEMMENIVRNFCREIQSSNFFGESTEICKVLDISESGLSFLHPQSLFFNKNFALGEVLIFNLNHEGKSYFLKSTVRNIQNSESKFRIGVEFLDLSQIDKKYIESILQLRRESENLIST